jgi:hypothetical protein
MAHGLTRFTRKDLELALALRNVEAQYQAIRRLKRYGLIKSKDNDLYEVDVEMAELIARLIPHPPGRRVYARQWVRETFPEWRTAEERYRQWHRAVMAISQGTIPPIADFAQFPIAFLRFPNGRCRPVLMVAGLYIIPSKELARRTSVYCVRSGPLTLCSASRAQLLSYLSPPCRSPDCPPAVPYPTPCEPNMDGLVADFRGRLIPLSALPRTARRYEPGVAFSSPVPYDLFSVEVSRRGGHPPHLRVVPRKAFVRDFLGADIYQFCQGVDALTDHALITLLSQYQALTAYGRSATGLPITALTAKSLELFDRAFEGRKRKPEVTPFPGPPQVFLRSVYYQEREGRGWGKSKLLDRELGKEWLTCEDIRARLLRIASLRRVRVVSFEVWVFLPDRDGSLSRDMSLDYDFIYHNARKDRPGTVRLEARPLGGVTSRLGPQEVLTHLYAKAHRIATAIKVVILTRHRTPRRPAPND